MINCLYCTRLNTPVNSYESTNSFFNCMYVRCIRDKHSVSINNVFFSEYISFCLHAYVYLVDGWLWSRPKLMKVDKGGGGQKTLKCGWRRMWTVALYLYFSIQGSCIFSLCLSKLILSYQIMFKFTSSCKRFHFPQMSESWLNFAA